MVFEMYLKHVFSTCDEAVFSWLGHSKFSTTSPIWKAVAPPWPPSHRLNFSRCRNRALHGGRAFAADPGGDCGLHHHPLAGGFHSEGGENGKWGGLWGESIIMVNIYIYI